MGRERRHFICIAIFNKGNGYGENGNRKTIAILQCISSGVRKLGVLVINLPIRYRNGGWSLASLYSSYKLRVSRTAASTRLVELGKSDVKSVFLRYS